MKKSLWSKLLVIVLCLVILTSCFGAGDKLVGKYLRTRVTVVSGVTITEEYCVFVYEHTDPETGIRTQYEVGPKSASACN